MVWRNRGGLAMVAGGELTSPGGCVTDKRRGNHAAEPWQRGRTCRGAGSTWTL